MSAFPDGYGVMVIGGGAGIGEATARYLAAAGVAVMVADRDAAGAERVADAIVAAGGRATGVRVDVTDPETLAEALTAMLGWNGRLHGVLNSAGIQGPLGRPSHEVEIAEFESTLRVNLTAGLV